MRAEVRNEYENERRHDSLLGRGNGKGSPARLARDYEQHETDGKRANVGQWLHQQEHTDAPEQIGNDDGAGLRALAARAYR
jgi:hypothetical protein